MAARLTSLAVEDYRSFRRFELELRPLTLLYGWNGSGKSAIIRLIGMIGAATRDRVPAVFELGGPARGDVPFEELVRKGKDDAADGGFKIKLAWDDGLQATWQLDRVLSTGRPRVEGLEVGSGPAGIGWRARATPTADRYLVEGEGGSSIAPLSFSGLVPIGAAEPVQTLAERLRGLDGQIQWLGNAREPVPRSLESGRVARELGSNGEDAISLVYQEPWLHQTIETWFRKEPVQRGLAFRPDGSRVRPVLTPEHARDRWYVDFSDAGAGFSHVLPLLVAAARAERSGGLLAAEEPESHLHTNAQRTLAEWLCDRVQGENPPTLVLETHSAVLVAAVQLAIARDPALADRVGAYWLETAADGTTGGTLITFDASGRPRGGVWPRDAFSDEFTLGRELAALRLAGGVPQR